MQDALEAVTKPVENTRRWFAAGTAEEIVAELSEVTHADAGGAQTTGTGSTVEPVVLQLGCAWLWRSLPSDIQVITTEHVRRYAGIDRSLADFCGQAVAEAAEDYGVSTLRLASWLQQTFIGPTGARAWVHEDTVQASGIPMAVLRALEDRHILRAELRADGRWYALLHDRLIEPLRRLDAPDLARAGQRPDTDAVGHLAAAALALAEGELALAERHAQEALRRGTDDDLRTQAEVQLVLGNIAHARGEPAAAEDRYRTSAALFEMLQDTPAVTRLLMAMGRSLLAQGRDVEAVDGLRAATERAPNDPAVRTEFGRTLWQVGQERAAVTVLTEVLAVNGDTQEALRARGEVLADLGKAEDALRDLDRVRQRPATRAARALALATLHDRHAAGEEIDAALADAPDSGPVLLYAARVGALGGDASRAAELARRAVTANAPALSPHQREEALRLTRHDPDEPADSPH
jgi:tetratricopeptide (TPR) repeat protein